MSRMLGGMPYLVTTATGPGRIAFSRDAQQKYMYLADGENDRVHIIERQSMEMLTTFGEGGRQPGMFYGVHSIAIDSKGNLYTAEVGFGRRAQKFRRMQ